MNLTVRFLSRTRAFSLKNVCTDSLTLLLGGYRAFFSRNKAAVAWSWPLIPTCAEVKRECNCSSSPMFHHGLQRQLVILLLHCWPRPTAVYFRKPGLIALSSSCRMMPLLPKRGGLGSDQHLWWFFKIKLIFVFVGGNCASQVTRPGVKIKR
jgi:hypothetical protein